MGGQPGYGQMLLLHRIGELPSQHFLDRDSLDHCEHAVLAEHVIEARQPLDGPRLLADRPIASWLVNSLIRFRASANASFGVFWVFSMNPESTKMVPSSTHSSVSRNQSRTTSLPASVRQKTTGILCGGASAIGLYL